MGLRREVLQVLFGAFFFALFLKVGLIKPSGPSWDNVIWGIVMLSSRLISFLMGG